MKKDEPADQLGGGTPGVASGVVTSKPDERTQMAEGSGQAAAVAGPGAKTIMAEGTGQPPGASPGAYSVHHHRQPPPPPQPRKSRQVAAATVADPSVGAPLDANTGDVTGMIATGLVPGARVHQYELIRELGAGGMGTVFLARDTKLGRRVAIKFLQTRRPELAQRFLLEARTTARCSHENIVIIYEVGEWHETPYMALEYLQGQPLSKFIEHGMKMPPQRAVELMAPVVRALVAAHEQGIVHRDLKPDNIFVTESGTIKVLDFGIAKLLQGEGGSQLEQGVHRRIVAEDLAGPEDNTNLTRHGAIMGTLAYMSPEQWGIGVPIDHRTDIWATGIMLFRMLAGRHPLEPLTGEQLVVVALVQEPMPRLQDAAPDVPPELCEIVDRCLLKKRDDRFPDAASLLRSLEPFMPGRFTTRTTKIEDSPYAGLSSFQEADADRFFGRSREIAAMSLRIQDRPLMAVIGPSGVGKSSFVRAGLVPALKHSGGKWECLVIRPGRSPVAALSSVLMPLMTSSTTVKDDLAEQRDLVQRLIQEPGYLGTALRARARRSGENVLLFVDQFEELYTLVSDPKERMAFTQCLSGLADDPTSPTRVVVSIRSDFLDRVSEDAHFMNEMSQGLFFMTAPTRDGLRDALAHPAEMAGYRFETPAIIEEMLDHLATTSGALPLLQFTAAKLWENRDPARKMLTESSYRSLGGIAGALASHADRVVGKLMGGQQALARAVFLRLVTPDRTRAIVSVDDLREMSRDRAEVQGLLDHLVQARLITVQTGGGASGATAELVHESLIHTWPMLRRWLDEGQEDAAFMEQLRNAAKQWQTKGRDKDLLWRGELADEAGRFLRRYRGDMPDHERRFLQAVSDLQLQAVRRKRMLVMMGGALLGLVAAAATVALIVIRQRGQEADKQAEAAKKAAVVARAAEAEAKTNLDGMIRKEQERQREEELKRQAEVQRLKAEAQVAMTNEELRVKNDELLSALDKAEEARSRARAEQERAEVNAAEALKAKGEALRAAQEVQAMLVREQERVKRLEKQIGSPVIDDLK